MLRWVFALVAACCVASGKEHDFYKLLKLGRRFTEKELKAAYREAAKKYHPDKNPEDPKAAKKFALVAEAYEVFSDPAKRRRYDAVGRTDAAGKATRPRQQRRPPPKQQQQQQQRRRRRRRPPMGAVGARAAEKAAANREAKGAAAAAARSVASAGSSVTWRRPAQTAGTPSFRAFR